MKTTTRFSLIAAAYLAGSFVASAADFPYFTDFSEERGFLAGGIPDSEGWVVRPESTVVATEHSVRAGQSVLLYHGQPPGAMRRGFTPNGGEIVFVDLFVRPSAGESVNDGSRISFDAVNIAFVRTSEGTTIAASDISADNHREWVDIRSPIPTNTQYRAEEWVRVTLRLDYDLSLYDIFVDGALAEYDLAFRPGRFNSGRSLTITGAHGAETWVDDIFAGSENPLFDDEARTGIPDDWHLSRGLSLERSARYEELPENDRAAIETFFAETRPDYSNAENRATVVERGKKLSERRLAVFTRLEKPDPEIQALINSLTE